MTGRSLSAAALLAGSATVAAILAPGAGPAAGLTPPAPVTTYLSGPGDHIASRSADFTFQADQTGVSYQVRRDHRPWSRWSWRASKRLTGLTAGDHEVRVRARSRTGRVGRPAVARFAVDLVAPQTAFTGAIGPATVLTPASAIRFASSESNSTFSCTVDGRRLGPCGTPYPLSGLTPGRHTVSVSATDPAGNADPSPATRAITVDGDAPQGTLFSDDFETGSLARWNVTTKGNGTASAQPAVVRNGSYAAQFSTFASPGSTAYARTSLSAAVADLTTVEAIRVETEGSSGGNAALLRLFDSSGARLVNLYRQNLTGAIWIQSGGSYTKTAGVLPLGTWGTVSLRVAGSTVEVKLDNRLVYSTGGASLAPVKSVQIGNEAPAQAGTVYLDDVAISSASADSTPPETTIDAGPTGTVRSSSASFAFSSSEAGSAFQCKLDGATYTACASPQAYTALADGNHTFSVRAIDPAGNVDPSPATASWTSSTAAGTPAVLIADNLNRRILITDYAGTVLWKLDNPTGETSAYSGPLGLRWMSNGHILATFGTGKVGEIDPATKTFVWITSGYNRDWFASPYDAQLLPDGNLAVASSRNEGGRVAVYNRATGALVWKHRLNGAHLVEWIPAGSGTGTASPTLLVGGYAPLEEVVYDPGRPDDDTVAWTWAEAQDTHRAVLDRDGRSLVLTETDNLIKVGRPDQTVIWDRPEGNAPGVGEARGVAMTDTGYALGWRQSGGASFVRFTDATGNVTSSFSTLSDGTSLNLVYAVQTLRYPTP